MQLRDLLEDVPFKERSVVPMELMQLLGEELNIADSWAHAEKLLQRAIDAMPDQLVLSVALYKLYAYSGRFDESLKIINHVLNKTSQIAGFASDWRQLTPQSTCWDPPSAVTRLYLYSLKATGFVRLRKGDLELASEVLEKLLELDPHDQVGGSVVFSIAERLLEDELSV